MNQEATFSGFFEIRYIINKIVNISLSNEKEKRVESETSLYYFNEYK